jgi:hypothetical protein
MGKSTRRGAWALTLGLLLVVAIAGGAGYAGWSLYSDFAWQASARSAAEQVASAVQAYSTADDTPPAAVDATTGPPGPGQVPVADLPYATAVPPEVSRIRITPDGALSVLTDSEALCSGVTIDLSAVGRTPRGAFFCGEALPPPAPLTLTATPRDEGVILEWPHPPAPVEDYVITWSDDDGATWTTFEDGVSAVSRATVRPLVNGRTYLFEVAAQNLAGASPPVRAEAVPFTEPAAPTGVRAIGGFTAVVSWTPPADDGGRPVTGYLVTGRPTGSCTVPATETRCELADLPAAPDYTFTVRAVNEGGAGEPSRPETDPVAVYSVPGRPVALSAAPGDRQVLLTWTAPLNDGNTPITEYRVEYRTPGAEEWTVVARPPSVDTTAVVTGLVNGTQYEFSVLAVNAVGASEPPLTTAVESPATVPGTVPSVDVVVGDSTATLDWTPPLADGGSAITDYVVAYRPAGGAWEFLPPVEDGLLSRDVPNLVNGTRYAFRVAAENRMGQGQWSPPTRGMPFGPPGPVRDPESEATLTAITVTWEPPANDGGRRLRAYLVDYRLSASPDWTRAARVPADTTTLTLDEIVGGESYDIRITAVNAAGEGPPTPDGLDRPTLAGVIADETPPAPTGIRAVPGDGQVTLRWQPSPAGPDSPITEYTVTGAPGGTCTTDRLSCTIRGLTNGVTYAFSVTASNANITGPGSDPVTATPRVYNAATGGSVRTYTRGGRTYAVHTFTSGGTFTVTSAAEPFSVLVVGGGGGSTPLTNGAVAVGGGGGIIDARRVTLPVGALAVAVGAGGPIGAPGGVSSLDAVGAAPAGVAGAPEVAAFSPTTTSRITGTPVTYGGSGTATSGQGVDGRGIGGGGPEPNRGGNGIVVIRYEIAPPAAD